MEKFQIEFKKEIGKDLILISNFKGTGMLVPREFEDCLIMNDTVNVIERFRAPREFVRGVIDG